MSASYLSVCDAYLFGGDLLMINSSLTTSYTLRLVTCGPTFIGSGNRVNKKEYRYSSDKGTVFFYDLDRLMDCIIKNDLIEEFEEYMLGSGRTLAQFFRQNGGTEPFESALKHSVSCGSAIFEQGALPADILLHCRNAAGKAYVPGSSIKGMLRTAITAGSILQNMPKSHRPSIPDTSENYYKAFIQDANRCMRQLDEELFHTLRADVKNMYNAVNNIFRGVSVSDSSAIPDQDMVLCRKKDLFPGLNGNSRDINVIRECIRPGCRIETVITLDQTLCGFLTPKSIMESIRQFNNWYTKNVFVSYPGVQAAQFPDPNKYYLFLGGGSGYFSKTVTAPWMGEDALSYITALLTLQFKGKNASDKKLGISPHMLKCTEINQLLYLFGLCEVEIL